MSQRANHLTDAQIEAFAAQTAGASFDADTHRLTGHITECDDCLGRYLQAFRSQLSFPVRVFARTAQCLTDDELKRMAAGIAGSEIAGNVLKHAPLCDHCGPLLRQYLEDFSEELPEDGRLLVSQSKSATAEWQRQMVRKIAGESFLSSVLDGLRSFWQAMTGTVMMRLATATVALVVVIGSSVALLPQYRLFTAERTSLAAASDGGQRTIAMRLPGAAYAPYVAPTIVMGDSAQESSRKSPALLESQADVARAQQSGGLDPRWRRIDGRNALLEASSSSVARAADTLEKASTEGPASPRLQIELAAAYFERDSRADKPNLAKTIDLLEGVLAMPDVSKEDRAVALFNVSIAYEKINAWQLVADRLTEYLRLDPSGAWSGEARTRLDKARAILPSPRPQGYRSPAFFFFTALIPAFSLR